MAQLMYKTEAAERERVMVTTVDKVIERQNRPTGQIRPGRGGGFSAGFLAGMVLCCDILAILLSGVVLYAVHPGDLSRGLTHDLTVVAVFGVLAVLVLHSTGLYHFTAIVEPKRVVLRIGAALVAIF